MPSSATDEAWRLLASYLDGHPSANAQYHRCVINKLLSHGVPLPDWLVKSYKVSPALRSPAAVPASATGGRGESWCKGPFVFVASVKPALPKPLKVADTLILPSLLMRSSRQWTLRHCCASS